MAFRSLAGLRQSATIASLCDALHNLRQATLLLKRLLLAAIAFGAGFGLTVLITMLIGTTPAEYGPVYMFFTTLTIGLACANKDVAVSERSIPPCLSCHS